MYKTLHKKQGSVTVQLRFARSSVTFCAKRDNGTWYYAADTGELQGGIMKINGNVYYFDTSTCKMVTGNYSYNGGTHEFTENGTTDGGPYVYNEWNSNGTIKRGTKFGVR